MFVWTRFFDRYLKIMPVLEIQVEMCADIEQMQMLTEVSTTYIFAVAKSGGCLYHRNSYSVSI